MSTLMLNTGIRLDRVMFQALLTTCICQRGEENNLTKWARVVLSYSDRWVHYDF